MLSMVLEPHLLIRTMWPAVIYEVRPGVSRISDHWRQLFPVVAVGDAVVAQDAAVVPDALHKRRGVAGHGYSPIFSIERTG